MLALAIVVIVVLAALVFGALGYLLYRKFYARIIKKVENGELKGVPLLGKFVKDREAVSVVFRDFKIY